MTHNADYLHYADRVLYMRDGMIVKEDRQERSLQELAEIRLDQEVGHWVREYHRKDLDAKAQELGLNPKDYHSESLLARTILIKSGFCKKSLRDTRRLSGRARWLCRRRSLCRRFPLDLLPLHLLLPSPCKTRSVKEGTKDGAGASSFRT